MSGKQFNSTAIDQHIGQRVQLRRTMMGLSQKDLAKICGVTFQQIQKYETAGNRIPASRLFELSAALETPITFFFQGLPGYMPEPNRSGRITRVSEQKADDPLAKNESLKLIQLYWKLPTDDQRRSIMNMLRALNGED
ncbi:MAG: helix-turn-helix transcriptional regulator [Proteobacteria bacterium]|uniref:Helix-turn-helix transcriptional regulator n=1 Tax=Candidatus Enterousia excrementavium TaxID=2840789 RepID=A0A940ICQ9_9PROT|nr:helix-turn-helix transcriptional regulator [Candidatus Enterousia excrementavium]